MTPFLNPIFPFFVIRIHSARLTSPFHICYICTSFVYFQFATTNMHNIKFFSLFSVVHSYNTLPNFPKEFAFPVMDEDDELLVALPTVSVLENLKQFGVVRCCWPRGEVSEMSPAEVDDAVVVRDDVVPRPVSTSSISYSSSSSWRLSSESSSSEESPVNGTERIWLALWIKKWGNFYDEQIYLVLHFRHLLSWTTVQIFYFNFAISNCYRSFENTILKSLVIP